LEENQNINQQPQSQEKPAVEEEQPGITSETRSVLPNATSETSTVPAHSSNLSAEDFSKTDNEAKPDTMEVHKHPHHVMHKKKFGEYVLEFFMLFLAVFLGFIAENIREHSVNKEIEKRNVESFVSNLREDSIALIGSIEVNKNRLIFLDSLLVLKSSQLPDRIFRQRFIYYMLKLGYLNYFLSNGSTFEQMRSSGTLRLLSHDVLDSILKYQTLFSNIRRQGEICIAWWNKSIEKVSENIDLVPLSQLGTNPLLDVTYQKLESIQLPEFPKDGAVLKSYYNWRMNERIAQAYYNEKLYEQLHYLRILLPFLQTKYHL
jgi:hypothetical protein